MPRAIDPDYEAHLQQHVTTTTRCLKIRRADGEIFAFTELDAELEIDLGDGDGAIVYTASNAATISAVSQVAGLQPDNFSIEGGLSAAFIDMEDLRNGLFFGAVLTFFECNWSSGTLDAELGRISGLTQDPMNIGVYEWGETQLRDYTFSADIRPLTDRLNQRIGDLVAPLCRADLGDLKCKVRVDPPLWEAATAYTARPARDAGAGDVVKPSVENGCHFQCSTAGTSDAAEPTWDATPGNTTADGTVVWTAIAALSQTGTVSAVVGRADFTATGISLAADWWNYGVLEWLTGANAGLKAEVKDDSGAGVLKLFLPAPYLPVIGDTFFVKAGCDKLRDTCKGKFDNIHNRRAEDYVPGADVALDYPDAS